MPLIAEKQLTKYYTEKGFEGNYLAAVVEEDMISIKKNYQCSNVAEQYSLEEYADQKGCVCIASLFTWSDSPQGHHYWEERNVKV